MKKLLLFLLLMIPGACYGDSGLLWNYRIGSGIWTVDTSTDGDYIAAGTFTSTAAGYGYGVYLFSKSGELLWKYGTTDVVWSVSMTTDGEYIAVGSKDKHVYLFDKSGTLLWKYKTDDTVWTVAISSNGDYIAAGSYDNNVYLFDKSGTLLWKYKTDDIVLSTSISSNGDYIAAGSYDNNVYLFDKSGTLLWKYKTDDVVLSTSISSNGDYIAAGSYDNNVYLFDKSGRLLFKYRTNNVLFSTSISSNGDYIAAGSYDNNVYLFDKSGNLLFEYMTEDEVWDVAISPDGSYISAASKDFNVYFFSSTGELLGKHSTGGYVSSVAISENGDYATAGSYDRSISFFSITPAPPVELETPKVDVLKTVTKSSLKPGENATVLIELRNVGEITARIVEFEDVIPEGFILVSGELSSISELIPGESKTFTYVIKAEEIKEQKEVVLPALDVSYIDIKGNQYTARSSDVFITVLPGKVRVLRIGLKERLGSVLALPGAGMKERLSAAVLSFLKVIFIVLVALFSFALVRRVATGRKTRRKIDKTEILTKIRKEIGVTGPGPSQMLPKDSKRAPQKELKKPIFGKYAYRKEKINLLKRLKREVKRAPHEAPADIVTEKASTQHKPAMVTKSRFGKPTYRKDMINLLKSLKREVKK